MTNQYYESAEDYYITRERALRELKKHNVPNTEIEDFDKEVKPNKDGEYLATDVLDWLGY